MPEAEVGIEVVLRPMRRGDVPGVERVDRASSDELRPGEATLATLLAMPECRGLVAVAGGRVVGFTLCRDRCELLEILLIADDPEFRGYGLTSRMLRHIVKWLTRLGYGRLEITVADSALEAHLFLRDEGFRAVDIDRDFGKAGVDGYRFAYQPSEVARG